MGYIISNKSLREWCVLTNIIGELRERIFEIGTVADLGPVPSPVLAYVDRSYWDKEYAKRKKKILKYKELLAKLDKDFLLRRYM